MLEKAMPPAKAYVENCGSLKTSPKLRRMSRGIRENDGSGPLASFNPKNTNMRISAEMQIRKRNNDGHPHCKLAKPPSDGAIIGDALITRINDENTLALSFTGKISRTIASAATLDAHPPIAWI